MWNLLLTIFCTTNPVCAPHTQYDPAICCSEPDSAFQTLTLCQERRDLILDQQKASLVNRSYLGPQETAAFVLAAQCYPNLNGSTPNALIAGACSM
jgi:hypothetical protein